jgi:hypothetical protein
MARDPEALLARLREQETRLADRLERHIDADLDENWCGGEFRFSRFQGRLGDGVITELKRRYDRWAVRQEVDEDGDGTLVFAPLLARHRFPNATPQREDG